MSHPRIRIIRHEAVPETGSFEVRFADGRPSKYFYYDDVLGRRLRPDVLSTRANALASSSACSLVTSGGGDLKIGD